jgi:hypothetical protein
VDAVEWFTIVATLVKMRKSLSATQTYLISDYFSTVTGLWRCLRRTVTFSVQLNQPEKQKVMCITAEWLCVHNLFVPVVIIEYCPWMHISQIWESTLESTQGVPNLSDQENIFNQNLALYVMHFFHISV